MRLGISKARKSYAVEHDAFVSCSNHFQRTHLAALVTEGARYSGCHAARALKRHGEDVILYDDLSRGHRVLAGDVELIEAEIADTEKLAAVLGRVDSVMHFAAYALRRRVCNQSWQVFSEQHY